MIALVLAAAVQASAPLNIRATLDPSPAGAMDGRFVEWEKTPTLAEIENAYPSGQHGRLAAALRCDVTSDGRMTGCVVWTQYPEDARVRTATRRLAGGFQTTPEFAKAAKINHSQVVFNIIFTPKGNEEAPFEGESCPPPFCIPVPPPPPPPK